MIIVASVSCLYGLGDPIDYKSMVVSLRVGQERPVDEILKKLTEIRYERNDIDFSRNKFRVRGDTLEVYPAYWSGRAIRVELSGMWTMWRFIPPATMLPRKRSSSGPCWKFKRSATSRW